MAAWLEQNAATVIISAVLLAVMILIPVCRIRAKKKGKSSCGCGCANCPMSGECGKKGE